MWLDSQGTAWDIPVGSVLPPPFPLGSGSASSQGRASFCLGCRLTSCYHTERQTHEPNFTDSELECVVTYKRRGKDRPCWRVTAFTARCRTISLETGAQNIQLCITMLQLSFTAEDLAQMFNFPLAYGLFQLLDGFLIVTGGWTFTVSIQFPNFFFFFF